MSEYWKSLPKKYCDFCKCWITDNKASRDFHERGFRHQANVRKRVKEIQRNGTTKDREVQAYNNELLKIEAAALSSFQGDVARNPSLSSEYCTTKSLVAGRSSESSEATKSVKSVAFSRFGETYGDGESETLVNGKKRALETIAKAFEKKSKWLEAKTSEGKTYYWNKDNLETRFDAPKSGFLSLEEQDQLKSSTSSSQSTSDTVQSMARADGYGRWRKVERDTTGGKMVDLQLPGQDVSQIVLDLHKSNTESESVEATKQRETFQFKEKTIEKSIVSKNEKESLSFKKSSRQRNIRTRTDN